jgi:glucan phosphoethanolaminetransferase (alkaline phosphatase superfamily)
MIQRIQTLWLLISTACAALFIFMPVYKGVYLNGTQQVVSIRENLFLLAASAILTTISFLTIFLFKNRRAQKRFIILNILLIIGVFIAQYYLIEMFKKDNGIVQGDWQMIAILPLFMFLLTEVL